MLGRSVRLGLAEAGRSEPLALRPTTLPRTAVLGAATAALCSRRVRTAGATRVATLPLPSHCRSVRTGPMHLCGVVGPVLVASAARMW